MTSRHRKLFPFLRSSIIDDDPSMLSLLSDISGRVS
jgi:hypothetical protein